MTSPKVLLAVLVVSAMAALSCGSSTKMVQTWTDPGYQKSLINKVLVIGIADSPGMRRTFETRLASAFDASGATAVPSFTILEETGRASQEAVREMVRKAVNESGAQAVTVTRLISSEKQQEWVEGTTYMAPSSYYDRFYGYYYNAYQVVHTPGYMVENNIYHVETNLYDVATEKLVWSGISETMNPSNVVNGMDDVARAVVRSLQKEGMLPQ